MYSGTIYCQFTKVDIILYKKRRDISFSRKKNQHKFCIISGMMKAKKKEAEVEKRITLSIAPRGKKKAVTVVQV